MVYRMMYSDELYHHGVKGMKWGVRKADYNTKGMKSSNIYSKISELERQEFSANVQNRRDYRAHKKDLKLDLKSQKKAKTISKQEYRQKMRDGKAAARETLSKNKNKIYSDFSKAYYDTISAGEIATARSRNSSARMWDSIMGDGSGTAQANSNDQRLNRAEERRRQFAEEYTMKSYKSNGKKR